METEWTRLLTEHWPTLTLVLAGCFGVYHIVRFLALTFGWGMGALGDFWRTRRSITDGEIIDLKKRVTYLDGQVAALRYRDECYFAYMLSDQEWHRKHELKAAAQGWTFDRHITFLEFRDQWIKDKKFQGREHDFWM